MLEKLLSKSFKLGFSSIWTENFQMYKMDLEKAEEPEIKLPTSAGSQKAKQFQKNIYFCFTDYKKTLTVDHNKLENFWRDENNKSPYLSPEIPVMWVKKQQLEPDTEQMTGLKLGNEYEKAVCCDPAYLTSMQSTSA